MLRAPRYTISKRWDPPSPLQLVPFVTRVRTRAAESNPTDWPQCSAPFLALFSSYKLATEPALKISQFSPFPGGAKQDLWHHPLDEAWRLGVVESGHDTGPMAGPLTRLCQKGGCIAT